MLFANRFSRQEIPTGRTDQAIPGGRRARPVRELATTFQEWNDPAPALPNGVNEGLGIPPQIVGTNRWIVRLDWWRADGGYRPILTKPALARVKPR